MHLAGGRAGDEVGVGVRVRVEAGFEVRRRVRVEVGDRVRVRDGVWVRVRVRERVGVWLLGLGAQHSGDAAEDHRCGLQ